MRYSAIQPALFIENRINFCKHLKDSSLAVFKSNDEFTRSGDQSFTFKQNADLFYLCGIDQEQTILLLYPDCPNPLYKEVLFLRQTSDFLKVWEGKKYSKEQAREVSGISSIYWLEDFDQILHSIIYSAKYLYLNSNENEHYAQNVPDANLRFVHQIKQKYPLHQLERSAPVMRALRTIKSDFEIELISKAALITKGAFERVLKFTKPGVKEYEIEAEVIHEFIRQGATGHSYPPIIASGSNANILHYTDNNQICTNGDMILFDFGAEYANYNADMSRSIPVNGRFSPRQKTVYESVLHVMKAAMKLMVTGTSWANYNGQVGELMSEQLVNLGLLSIQEAKVKPGQLPAYKRYFMHGASHHLGIDVHDLADRYADFAVGNVLTIEPGIYISEEGLGIRLENNILITSDGNIDLMRDIPLEIEEIEDLMNR
ncbi:aminopeptidase P family protein [Pedobacter sp. AW1-32]|uniref:aminopeptidase P family protein n=1 Tax=Pedobacter sp. AW1-32 TaxID=3383026 RepID=UPI003FEE56E5